MKTIARITAIILIVLGILVMLGGIATGIGGALHFGQRALNGSGTAPARTGGLLGGTALAIILFIQGVMVIATGEGLYLLADLASRPTV